MEASAAFTRGGKGGFILAAVRLCPRAVIVGSHADLMQMQGLAGVGEGPPARASHAFTVGWVDVVNPGGRFKRPREGAPVASKAGGEGIESERFGVCGVVGFHGLGHGVEIFLETILFLRWSLLPARGRGERTHIPGGLHGFGFVTVADGARGSASYKGACPFAPRGIAPFLPLFCPLPRRVHARVYF